MGWKVARSEVQPEPCRAAYRWVRNLVWLNSVSKLLNLNLSKSLHCTAYDSVHVAGMISCTNARRPSFKLWNLLLWNSQLQCSTTLLLELGWGRRCTVLLDLMEINSVTAVGTLQYSIQALQKYLMRCRRVGDTSRVLKRVVGLHRAIWADGNLLFRTFGWDWNSDVTCWKFWCKTAGRVRMAWARVVAAWQRILMFIFEEIYYNKDVIYTSNLGVILTEISLDLTAFNKTSWFLTKKYFSPTHHYMQPDSESSSWSSTNEKKKKQPYFYNRTTTPILWESPTRCTSPLSSTIPY